jgi:3-hydroxybutyryl-CoA dehydrogenase
MEINTIGVIGAGTIGPRIAYVAALAGYKTILQGVSPELLEEGVVFIRHTLDADVAAGIITPQQRAAATANLESSRSVEDVCRKADLLIDATQEESEVKLEIFTLFDKFAKPDAILASTSLTIPISDLAEITFRAENCVGLRFGTAVPQSKALEIIRTAETSEATVTTCVDVARSMKREAVVVQGDFSRRNNPP